MQAKPITYLEISTDERSQLIREYQETQNQDVATQLLMLYEPMVKMAAGKIGRNTPQLYEDLFQVGQISLLRSLGQYDPALGNEFEPYAMKSMIGHMKNYLRDKAWYVQVPRRIKEKSMQVQQTIDLLTMKLERSPGIDEIAAHLGLSVEETVEILAGRDYFQFASLDTPLQKEGSPTGTLADIVKSDEDVYRMVETRLDLQDALQKLGDEERRVIHLIYVDGHSQRKIAAMLGISQMSVCRIQKRAMDKLKEYLDTPREALDG
ncbi:sigma-70 family RNA polymerase sigma factor [Brevibacillus dissolubilis]|uniref:sigma-70 family RNA polymerase sigma factor n=1 Tax=Brevibacillus dissolubilis TaxID=1844116 RepID=UPI001115D8A8|nr:sigma-70 family RNA polymerase sigma factor [Brevibacillus dissolubilis]